MPRQVTDVTVTYGRTIQPKEYESKRGEITFKAQIGPDENYAQVGAELLTMALAQVHAALGLKDQPPVNASEGQPAEPPAKTPRKRRSKTQIEADEKAAAEMASQDAGEGKAADTPEFDGEAEVTDAGVSDKDLQSAASKAATTHGAAKVHDLMKEWKVIRLGQLSQADRPKFLEALEGLK